MTDAQMTLPDGRTIAFTDIGEPGWPCVLLCHGAPASRLRVAYLQHAFQAAAVRVVCPDRPGYGRSSPQPGRSLTDWPRDAAALADALGIERFVAAGHSSGGPYAVACAAHLPERVAAAITLGGVTDMTWPGAFDGYPKVEAHLMRMPGEAAATAWCVERFGADGSRFLTASGFSLPGPDSRLYEDEEVASLLATARAEAFRQGVAAYVQDLFVQKQPWSFDLRAITAPVYVLHGAEDTLLPVAHSRHTAALIPVSEIRVLPGHGHFTILEEIPRLVAEVARAGHRGAGSRRRTRGSPG